MKVYISYFYMVRFMKSHHIPLSTAVWDPKWFHAFQNQRHTYVDKHGVVNGMRAEPLSPKHIDAPCPECTSRGISAEGYCDFLREYAKYLDSLDCQEIIDRGVALAKRVQTLTHFEREPILVFLVHETPGNPCSERGPLKSWFESHGIEVEEFTKESE